MAAMDAASVVYAAHMAGSSPMAQAPSPQVAAWLRRQRWARRLRIAVWVLAAVCISVWLMSLWVHWSMYVVTSPVTPLPTTAASAAGPPSVGRWETHLMLGDGRLRLHPMFVYTAADPGFDTPLRDEAEASLAWAVAGQNTAWPSWQWNWGNGWPMVHLPVWPAAFVSGSLAAWLLARRLSRPKPWACRGCRYDLRGQSPGGAAVLVCPECGSEWCCRVCGHPMLGSVLTGRCVECGWGTTGK